MLFKPIYIYIYKNEYVVLKHLTFVLTYFEGFPNPNPDPGNSRPVGTYSLDASTYATFTSDITQTFTNAVKTYFY